MAAAGAKGRDFDRNAKAPANRSSRSGGTFYNATSPIRSVAAGDHHDAAAANGPGPHRGELRGNAPPPRS